MKLLIEGDIYLGHSFNQILSVAFVAAPRPPTRRVGGGHPNRQDSSIATIKPTKN